METPTSPKQAAAYLAAQVLELYLKPPAVERLEIVDQLLTEAGLDDPSDRDKILALCDKALLRLEGDRQALARLLLRCPMASLDAAERQMQLKFG